MLERKGAHKQADMLFDSIEGVFDENPYRWLEVAERQLQKGNVAIAYKYYQRAIEVAPYLHESYFGLARLHHLRGEVYQAKAALKVAHEYAYIPEQKKLYQAKLMSFNL